MLNEKHVNATGPAPGRTVTFYTVEHQSAMLNKRHEYVTDPVPGRFRDILHRGAPIGHVE